MGEVYLAHDTRLDRQVALKVLPPDLANDPMRRQRFLTAAQGVPVRAPGFRTLSAQWTNGLSAETTADLRADRDSLRRELLGSAIAFSRRHCFLWTGTSSRRPVRIPQAIADRHPSDRRRCA